MKNLFLLIIGFILLSQIVKSQDDADTAWKTGGDFSLMFAQSSFTNWSTGGENSITFNGFTNLYARYEKGKNKWENILSLAYGQTKTGKKEFRKSEDKIDFLSAYGIKAKEKWYYTANFNFKSQFTEGFEYPYETDTGKVKISNFLAPAFTSLGLGIEYRPHDYLSIYMSPATARLIIVNDQDLADAGAFGVEPAKLDENDLMIEGTGETSKFEFGAYFRFMFVKDIVKNVNLSTKLELFSNYLENPQNIDVNWDTMINMSINSWLAASVGLQMVYDHDTPIMDKDGNIGPRTQIKQLLSIGLNYNFSNH